MLYPCGLKNEYMTKDDLDKLVDQIKNHLTVLLLDDKYSSLFSINNQYFIRLTGNRYWIWRDINLISIGYIHKESDVWSLMHNILRHERELFIHNEMEARSDKKENSPF